MAGDSSTSRIVYQKDERGVILGSAVVVDGDDVPEGYEDSVEYESFKVTEKEAAPVDESKLTVSEDQVDLRQTIDVIKDEAGTQEGPSDPGGASDADYEIVTFDGDGPKPGDEVVVEDPEGEREGATIDEIKDESDTQEGPSDPGGEESAKDDPEADDEPKKSSRRSRS